MSIRQWAVCGLTIVNLAWVAPAAQAQAPAGPRVTSPEVAADGRVTFRILAPKAQAVRLLGDVPSDGPTVPMQPPAGHALTQGQEGVWEVTIGPLAPGSYRYNFNVDGVSVIDPRNPSTSESNDNTWSLVHVAGADFMDTKHVPHGAVAAVTYYSTALKRFRRMHVYTPPGYETSTERYPVFYLLHGAMDCDDSWWTVGRAGFILDNLIAAGKAKPMIVVMPAGHTGPFDSTAARRGRRSTSSRATSRATSYPTSRRHYRVLTDRQSRAIAGLSMGGAQTLEHRDPPISPGTPTSASSARASSASPARGPMPMPPGPSFEEQNARALDDPALKKDLKLVWFATGKDDFLIETSRATVAMLKKHGFDVAFKESAGAHTWTNWREYLNEFAPLLFR